MSELESVARSILERRASVPSTESVLAAADVVWVNDPRLGEQGVRKPG